MYKDGPRAERVNTTLRHYRLSVDEQEENKVHVCNSSTMDRSVDNVTRKLNDLNTQNIYQQSDLTIWKIRTCL